MRRFWKRILIALTSLLLLSGLGTQQQHLSRGSNAETGAAQAQTQVIHTTTSFASLQPHHVALSVPNLEETIQWYQDKLGFITTLKRELPQFSTRQAFLELNGFRMELFERENSARIQPSPTQVPDDLLTQGYKHIAFTVDNIAAIATELKQRDVEIALEPVADEELRLTLCFIKDNNGNLIELVQELNL